MSIDIRRLIEVISDEPTRRALERLSSKSLSADDVRAIILKSVVSANDNTEIPIPDNGDDDDDDEGGGGDDRPAGIGFRPNRRRTHNI